jgi:hypothetical protein
MDFFRWSFLTNLQHKLFLNVWIWLTRESGQIKTLLAALSQAAISLNASHNTTEDLPLITSGSAAHRLPAISALFAAEAAVALLHPKHFLYRPIDKLLKRGPSLNLEVRCLDLCISTEPQYVCICLND